MTNHNEPGIDAVIPAYIVNDSGTERAVHFDALPWFANYAADGMIGLLAVSGFKACDQADSVAWHSPDPSVEEFLTDMVVLSKYGLDGGYEVHVDKAAALEWIRVNRPHLRLHLED